MIHTFVGDASYALLLYLLYVPKDVATETQYFVGKNLSPCILPNKVVMPPFQKYTEWQMLKYRVRCWWKYRGMIKATSIFAQDHLPFSAPLIDNLQYICLEDCPNFFSIREQRGEPPYQDSLRARLYNLEVGRIYQRYAGCNPYCIKRIVTSVEDVEMLERKRLAYENVNLQKLWSSASSQKQQMILRVFALENMESIANKDVVLFSQPLMEDAHLMAEEVISLYKPYIDKYGAKNILVKLHPRDNFDYQTAFPGIATLKTKAPQQLFSAMGIKYKTAITCCSSAVSSMDKDCETIWLGAEVDERIVQAYGHVKNPTI